MTGSYDGSALPDANQGDIAPFVNAPSGSMNLDISTPLETGVNDPMRGIHNVSRDTNGSYSYGNYGLNSQPGASAWQFRDVYGKELGLTANPGTREFTIQWAAAAHNDPEKLRSAEQDWYDKNVLQSTSEKLQAIGVSPEVAQDPRVQAYFADRTVQQGPASITNAKHSARINQSWNASGGDPVTFLKIQSAADLSPQALHADFPAALASGVYSDRGNFHRVTGRLSGALNVAQSADNSLPMTNDPDSQMAAAIMQGPILKAPQRHSYSPSGGSGQRRMDDNNPQQGGFMGLVSALLGGSSPQGPGGYFNPYEADTNKELIKTALSPGGSPIGRLAMLLAGNMGNSQMARNMQQYQAANPAYQQAGGQQPLSYSSPQPSSAAQAAPLPKAAPPQQQGGGVSPQQPAPIQAPQQVVQGPQDGQGRTWPATNDASVMKAKIEEQYPTAQIQYGLSPATQQLNPKLYEQTLKLAQEKRAAMAAIDNEPMEERDITENGITYHTIGNKYKGWTLNPARPSENPGGIAAEAGGQKTASEELAKGKMVPISEAIKEGTASRKANSALETLETINNLPGSENVNSGPWAEHLLNAKKILKDTLGWDMGGIEQAEGIEKMNTYLSQQAAKELTNRPTQFDFKTFIENNPGIEMSAEGRKMMIDILKQTTSQGIGLAKLAQKLKPEDASDWYDIEEKYYKEHPVIIHYKGQSYDTSKPYVPEKGNATAQSAPITQNAQQSAPKRMKWNPQTGAVE